MSLFLKAKMILNSIPPLIVVCSVSFLITNVLLKNDAHAHMKGTFSSKKEAQNRSLELGCEGIHKNKDKWMPCKNEEELHIYLRK